MECMSRSQDVRSVDNKKQKKASFPKGIEHKGMGLFATVNVLLKSETIFFGIFFHRIYTQNMFIILIAIA
jgi:hypothetical protein